ncbi:hypothetical protein ASG43_05410 [Aureimonas sp. Leaf454]|uniref:SHOCT domain-containing protein n=1 Tax=Aureimonas sp. Leaf454 TaxID=1736381 RepID=UPI0006FBABFA|nr:SHOCT domain-containing protein [Aureimonas sp. Leaf454]KQT50719.1 hypothetical protein ASG43_05410 [Aureimonas sp. Leaf454]
MTRSLTEEARRTIADIAGRHGFEPGAGEAMAEALMRSGGGMVQFNHRDLGGMGQWSKGGMMMIGEMNNDRLKARVGDLARDLSEAVQRGALAEESGGGATAPAGDTSSPSSSPSGAAGGGSGSWWPSDLGRPSSTGSQNNARYAVFPEAKRLAVEDGGKVTVYDTGEDRIEGASQQQGGDTVLRFSTRNGSIRVEDLKVAGDGDGEDDVRAKRSAEPASPAGTIDALGRSHPAGDPIETIRRLAALRDEGVIGEAEFAAKKAELLSRL